MSNLKFTSKAEKINRFIETTTTKLSRDTQFVQRVSKLNGELFAKILMTGWLKNSKAGLEMLCKRADDFGVNITPQGLSERFNERAVTFLEQLFKIALQEFQSKRNLDVPLLNQFSAIELTDSSQIELPSKLAQKWKGSGGCASKSALKMHLKFDFLHGSLSAISLMPGATPDTSHKIEVKEGSLSIFDLGYFVIERFKEIDTQKAFYISRLRPNTNLFEAKDGKNPIDLEEFCQNLTVDNYETYLFLGTACRHPVRVLFSRCPQQVVDERRRKAKASARRKRIGCTEKHLKMLEWSIFITNVPETMLNFAQVIKMYSVRWQIELIFKLCKSLLHIDNVQGCGEHRILCQLYVRLILFVLLCDFVSDFRLQDNRELSLTKSFNVFSDYADRLIACLKRGRASLVQFLMDMEKDFLRFALKTKRKKSPSTLQLFIYDFP